MTAIVPRVGMLIRDWRTRRRLSQMELALEAGISPRHLSFVETGRSQPGRSTLMSLAEVLEVPLRDRNLLLLSAGLAPAYAERSLGDSALDPAREAVSQILRAHEPYPAVAVDRSWNLILANRAVAPLLVGVARASASAARQRTSPDPASRGHGAPNREPA